MTKFEKVKGGMLGLVANENGPDHVQVRRQGNEDSLVPDVAVSIAIDGSIVVQVRMGTSVVLTTREQDNPS